MTWTFDDAPGTSTAAGRRDAVRSKIGDVDTNDQQISDEQIAFALDQASDDIYIASVISARTIAALYARRVDTDAEGLSARFSQRRDAYLQLAKALEVEAKKYGSVGLGVPLVGGVKISEMDSVEEDDDRVRPSFRRDQFRNPQNVDGLDDWYYRRR